MLPAHLWKTVSANNVSILSKCLFTVKTQVTLNKSPCTTPHLLPHPFLYQLFLIFNLLNLFISLFIISLTQITIICYLHSLPTDLPAHTSVFHTESREIFSMAKISPSPASSTSLTRVFLQPRFRLSALTAFLFQPLQSL